MSASATALTWVSFGVVVVAAGQLGQLAPHLGLPLISGFLIVGVLCGPFGLNFITAAALPQLGLVTQASLAFICLSAGSELYLPELRALFRRIAAVTVLVFVSTFVLTTVFVFVVSSPGTGLLPFVEALSPGCRLSVASIIASIMVARSPASAIAVVKETKSKGMFTSTLLGITVLCDVVVLLAFTLTTTVAQTECRANESFSGVTLLITLGTIALSLAIGWVVGKGVILLMSLKRVPLARFLILPLGLAIFVACTAVLNWSHENLPYVVALEPLLICICAGYVCTNQSKNRHRFVNVLQVSGPFIFLPFFTATGASLDLGVLAASISFALILALFRAATIFIGSAAGAHLTGAPHSHSAWLWATLLTQAGVSLGLASEVGAAFDGWGRSAQTAIIAVVLINQVAGPVLFKVAVRRVGDAGKATTDEGVRDEDEAAPAALVVGSTGAALLGATRLLHQRYDVALLAADDAAAAVAGEAVLRYCAADRLARAPGHVSAWAKDAAALAQSRRPVDEVASALRQLATRAMSLALGAASGPAEAAAHEGHEERKLEAGFRVLSFNVPAPPQHTLRSASAAAVTATGPQTTGLAVSLSAAAEAQELHARLAAALTRVANVESVYVALPTDAATFGACEAVLRIVRATSRQPQLPAIRVVAHVQASVWAAIFSALGVVPVVDSLSGSALAAALLTGSLARPISVLRAPGNLAALCGAVDDHLIEGPHLWALLAVDDAEASVAAVPPAELIARASSLRKQASRDAAGLSDSPAGASATIAVQPASAQSTATRKDPHLSAAAGTDAPELPQGQRAPPSHSLFSSLLGRLRDHVELDEDEGGDDGAGTERRYGAGFEDMQVADHIERTRSRRSRSDTPLHGAEKASGALMREVVAFGALGSDGDVAQDAAAGPS